MSEKVNDKTVFSLLEVTKSIKQVLGKRYQSAFWVKAEMNKLNFYSHSGHCYPELVEKRETTIVAQVRGNLWKDDYQKINKKFLDILKEPLKDGIKILFLARISFDPVHGLALNIIDIDPAFTLGDLERDKQETINKLQAEGIFNRNKNLKLPLLPQRLAIISVETSKGYADFLRVIDNNVWGYKFFHILFPSLLQGEKAVDSIIRQLNRIKKQKEHFDAVAIIRGGGGDVGLSCFNDYRLSKEIVLFPMPVITGIGHATNLTVVEMVSFENAITPTKIAEYLLQKFHNFSIPVQDAEKRIIEIVHRRMEDAKSKLNAEIKLFKAVAKNIISINRNQIKELNRSLSFQLNFLYKELNELLNSTLTKMKKGLFSYNNLVKLNFKNIEKNIHNLDPANVLKRGYSITLHNGKPVKTIDEVTAGSNLNTIVLHGSIISTVKSTNK